MEKEEIIRSLHHFKELNQERYQIVRLGGQRQSDRGQRYRCGG